MSTKLKDNIGGELFFRSNHGLYPTELANELYPRVSSVLRELLSLNNIGNFSPENLQRTFEIGCLDIDLVAIFAPLFPKLRQIAPLE